MSKCYKYKVSDVWGAMEGRLENGQTIIDTNHGKTHPHTVYNMDKLEPVGGWFATRGEEVTDPAVVERFQ